MRKDRFTQVVIYIALKRNGNGPHVTDGFTQVVIYIALKRSAICATT